MKFLHAPAFVKLAALHLWDISIYVFKMEALLWMKKKICLYTFGTPTPYLNYKKNIKVKGKIIELYDSLNFKYPEKIIVHDLMLDGLCIFRTIIFWNINEIHFDAMIQFITFACCPFSVQDLQSCHKEHTYKNNYKT